LRLQGRLLLLVLQGRLLLLVLQLVLRPLLPWSIA
jgi:hypothetical protein